MQFVLHAELKGKNEDIDPKHYATMSALFGVWCKLLNRLPYVRAHMAVHEN